MKNVVIWVVIITLVAVMIGCSSKPSMSEGRSILEKSLQGIAKVVSFKKTGAQEGEVFGVKVYEIKYEAEIECLVDCYVNQMGIRKAEGIKVIGMELVKRQGERIAVKGDISFEKTEKGWDGSLGAFQLGDVPVKQSISAPASPDAEASADNIPHNETWAECSVKMLCSQEVIWEQQDVDGNGIKDYWTYDVSCFYRMYRFDGTTKVAIIDSSFARADANRAVDGVFGATPTFENWDAGPTQLTPAPKSGYWIRAMTTDETGMPYNQNKVNGIIKATNNSKFAFVAYPAEYGKTGRRTFIINQNMAPYAKDTSGKPVLTWPANPAGEGWQKVQ